MPLVDLIMLVGILKASNKRYYCFRYVVDEMYIIRLILMKFSVQLHYV